MDPAIATALAMGVVELLMCPVVVFVIKKFLSRRLDDFDRKREEARVEQERENLRSESHQAAMEKGMRSLLRAELIHEHRKWMARGHCTLESKEYAQHTYEAYHGLGGNDIGTSMYRDIMDLPTWEVDE